jgi:hypothetical protein
MKKPELGATLSGFFYQVIFLTSPTAIPHKWCGIMESNHYCLRVKEKDFLL